MFSAGGVHPRKNFNNYQIAENESFNPLSTFIHCKNLLAFTFTLPIIFPYLDKMPNTLDFCPKLKKCRQPFVIEHEEP